MLTHTDNSPDIPYRNDRKSNPALRGPILVVCAYMCVSYFYIDFTGDDESLT